MHKYTHLLGGEITRWLGVLLLFCTDRSPFSSRTAFRLVCCVEYTYVYVYRTCTYPLIDRPYLNGVCIVPSVNYSFDGIEIVRSVQVNRAKQRKIKKEQHHLNGETNMEAMLLLLPF